MQKSDIFLQMNFTFINKESNYDFQVYRQYFVLLLRKTSFKYILVGFHIAGANYPTPKFKEIEIY